MQFPVQPWGYKSQWNRKHLVVIDHFFPSSRLCRGCGAVNGELTLSDRHWVCRCGLVHDRDGSAAINIRDEGLIERCAKN